MCLPLEDPKSSEWLEVEVSDICEHLQSGEVIVVLNDAGMMACPSCGFMIRELILESYRTEPFGKRYVVPMSWARSFL